MKGNLNQQADDVHDDDDEVFVTADPIMTNSSVVKSAMIVSAYCTTTRASTKKAKNKKTNNVSTLMPAASPSPTTNSEDNCSDPGNNSSNLSHTSGISIHDQDSGYDGYCPDKSLNSLGSSESPSMTEDVINTSTTSHGSQGSHAIYGHLGLAKSRNRPQSVYEKQFGPVQQCLQAAEDHQNTLYSNRSHIVAQATVVNLVKTSNNVVGLPETPPVRPLPPRELEHGGIPPPLPPRPAHIFASSTPTKPCKTYSSASLPRSSHRRAKKLQAHFTMEADDPSIMSPGHPRSHETTHRVQIHHEQQQQTNQHQEALSRVQPSSKEEQEASQSSANLKVRILQL